MKKILFFIPILIVVIIVLISSITYQKTSRPISYFLKAFSRAQVNKQQFLGNSISIMVLGLDRRNDLLEQTEATDTIMLANANFKTAKLSLISIPRDLWSYSTGTKINSIYPLSKEKPEKFTFIQDEFKKITNQQITKTIVITTENLIDFVKLIGGVNIYLENGFIDEKYPNPDYIKNPLSSVPAYKTIEFKAGQIHLDESNITEFVRSRKSAETSADGGTDIGRILRQQILIETIMQKIKSPDYIKNPQNLINLYNFWQKSIETNISDTDIISWGLLFGKNIKNITIKKTTIPTAEYPEKSIIYHPYKFINPQWVYIPEDENYEKLHQFIQQSIDGQ